ncbi:MAG: glycosyltransferase family 39 protein [Planctomycetales bacterium]
MYWITPDAKAAAGQGMARFVVLATFPYDPPGLDDSVLPNENSTPLPMATRQKIHPLEVLALVLAAVAILGGCAWSSSSVIFWLDEILTALPAGDPSFSHMLSGLKDELNAMPPLYFVLTWLWAQVAGVSELSLRLPSAIMGVVGMVGLWSALRSFLQRGIATCCAISLLLLCPEFREHLYEARGYSHYFAGFALAFALYVRADLQPLSRGALAWPVVGIHAWLVAIHYVGGLLSGLLVGSALLSWKLGGNPIFRRYAVSAMLGWLAFLPSIPFYLAQRRLAGEFNWLPRPSLPTLLQELVLPIDGLGLLVVGALFLWRMMERRSIDSQDKSADSATEIPLHLLNCLGAALVFVPAVWLESQAGARIFLPRYLYPVVVCWIALLAWGLARLWEKAHGLPRETEPEGATVRTGRVLSPTLGASALCATLALAATLALFRHARRVDFPYNEAQAIRAKLREAGAFPELPVVTLGTHEFACLNHYLGSKQRVLLLVDDAIPRQRGYPIIARNALALQRHYTPDQIITTPGEFFAQQERCLVLADDAEVEVLKAAAPDGAWTRQPGGEGLWLWERRAHGDDSGGANGQPRE